MKDWLWPKSYARDILMGALGVFSGDMNEILKRLALNQSYITWQYSVSQVRIYAIRSLVEYFTVFDHLVKDMQ